MCFRNLDCYTWTFHPSTRCSLVMPLPFFSFPEPCQVEVRLLLAYSSDLRIPKTPWTDGVDMPPQVEASTEGTIPFSKPVKVYIMPKPARR